MIKYFKNGLYIIFGENRGKILEKYGLNYKIGPNILKIFKGGHAQK